MSKYKIDKGDVIGYLIIEPNSIKVHYKEEKKNQSQKKKCPDNYFPKDWEKKGRATSKKKRHLFVKQGFF